GKVVVKPTSDFRYSRGNMTNETIRQDTTIMYQIAYPRTKTTSRAFTRLDLVMAIAALFVLGIIALPLLANNDRASERAVCWNNLRMVGRGVQTWASDRNGLPPWGVPTTAGGTYIASKSGSAYLEYAWMSNELVTPKILACPTDFGVKVERDWGAFRFISGSSALSYNLGLESGRGGGLDWISSDRNVRFDGNASSCTLGIVNAELISV